MIPTNDSSRRTKIPIIGLIGGIASGKSFVAEEFAKQHCQIVDADKLGHAALADPEIQRKLQKTFGESIVATDGSIDRRKLAEIVFGPEAAQMNRRKLELILHPEIRRRAEQQIAATQSAQLTATKSNVAESNLAISNVAAIILDAPLLLEAAWDSLCDYIIFVETADEVRMARAANRGWTKQQWQAREATQMSMNEKRRAATHIVCGEQSPEQLRLKVREILSELST